jgi:hypothetical protein
MPKNNSDQERDTLHIGKSYLSDLELHSEHDVVHSQHDRSTNHVNLDNDFDFDKDSVSE